MQIIKTPAEMQKYSENVRHKGQRIGFVPTMGYLHAGHLSLVEEARTRGKADVIVMSIFVNPTQFGPNEDLAKYPRDFERDRAMAESAGVDVVFFPDASEIYTPGAMSFVEVESMGKVMCGVSRPTHFRGVTTVVAILFSIVRPHVAIFGQKDAQQFFIIKRMSEDLHFGIELIMAPILRESDGLAMSSRNIYLDAAERQEALGLSRSLKIAETMIEQGEPDPVKILAAMKEQLAAYSKIKIDYVMIVEPGTLRELTTIKGTALVAVAAYLGKTRLIDNVIVKA